jgi:hypothetical protein
LLGLIDNLGAITHMFLLPLPYPANIEVFSSTIFPLIAFDILHLDYLNELIFANVEEDGAISDSFEVVGYESVLFIPLLGDIFYFTLIYPILAFSLLVAMCYTKMLCCCRCRKFSAYKYLENKYNELIWNGLISFFY